MLVLAHTDTFGINFDQFGQWVHESAAYTHRAAYCHIFFGEFLSCHLAGGVDRGSGFIHLEYLDRRGKFDFPEKVHGFATRRAISNGNSLNAVFIHQVFNFGLTFEDAFLWFMRINSRVVQQISVGVEADYLAAGAETGVNTHDTLFTERGTKQ